MAIGTRLGGTDHDRSMWLVLLFLLISVAAPTGCVLWFMNQAAESQATAARQSVMEAYRGQLQAVRDRVDQYWRSRLAKLDKETNAETPEDFARMAASGAADSFLFLHADGSLAYPSVPRGIADTGADRADWRATQALETTRDFAAAITAYRLIAKFNPDPSLRARAAQGQIRSLLRTPNREAAITAILDYFMAGNLVNATDLEGRMIAADEHLLALRLMNPNDRRRSAVLLRLTGWLNDYRLPIPSAQRLFLIGELVTMGSKVETFPTFWPERLAAMYLEAESPQASGEGLRETRLSRVWRLSAKGGRVIALYRNETAVASMRPLLEEKHSKGVQFTALPPGATVESDTLPAGPLLPGWQISFLLRNTREMEEASLRRKTAYLWVGYVMIASMILTGLIVGQAFRRQLRLARLKTDLVAAVSHELKTPLASMRLLVDSLLDDEYLDPQKTREYLALIAGENLRLTRLIENFLTFSRIERNRHRFEFIDAEPASIVETAMNSVRERFEQPGCRVEVQVEPALPQIHVDTDALVTVLINLLDNAYKYTRGEKHIIVRVSHSDDAVMLSVADNGIGIEAREQKRIFRKFYQVDRRLSREAGGCGLGLSIVESIVRAHGGTVVVESRPGEGSTFTVTLPLAATLGQAILSPAKLS